MDNEEGVVKGDERYAVVSKGIIVAKDRNALREYEKSAQRKKDEKKTLNTLREDVDGLKDDISDIKGMLQQIIKTASADSDNE